IVPATPGLFPAQIDKSVLALAEPSPSVFGTRPISDSWPHKPASSAAVRELVLRLASVLWRLRRATGIETGLFESVIEDSHKHEQHRLSRENLGEVADLAERRRLFLGAVRES